MARQQDIKAREYQRMRVASVRARYATHTYECGNAKDITGRIVLCVECSHNEATSAR